MSGFQVVLSVLVPLMPLGFTAQSEFAWQFVCAALGGLMTGWLQWRMFQPSTRPQLVWVVASFLGWLLTYALLGVMLYATAARSRRLSEEEFIFGRIHHPCAARYLLPTKFPPNDGASR